MPEQTYDYLIAPKASFDATADAIRALNGSTASITWGQDGFADAIGDERRYGYEDIVQGLYEDAVVNLPTATYIKTQTFHGDTALQAINAPQVIKFSSGINGTGTTGSYVFASCTNLTSVNLPLLNNCNSGGYQFAYCTSLQTINLPKSTTGQHMFDGCTSLVNAVIGSTRATSADMNGYGFNGCSKLEVVDLGNLNRIYTQEFNNCTKLTTIILRKTSGIFTLSNINAFNGTPFKNGGTGGTIYIPKAFYDVLGTGTNDYQSATNWSTIYGYGTITWAKIEGSQYENYYADGTPIQTT